jgi:hypothetical protein
MFVLDWLDDMQREKAKRGDGLNKLRTYSKFKSVFGMEPYLLHVKHEGKRLLLLLLLLLLLFKFRAGIAPLRIETLSGRYESNVDIVTGQARKGVPSECRICKCCYGDVEDEFHFLLECPQYKALRHKLLYAFRAYCTECNQPFPENRKVLFNFLMACQDIHVINAVATYLWEAFNYRTSLIGSI